MRFFLVFLLLFEATRQRDQPPPHKRRFISLLFSHPHLYTGIVLPCTVRSPSPLFSSLAFSSAPRLSEPSSAPLILLLCVDGEGTELAPLGLAPEYLTSFDAYILFTIAYCIFPILLSPSYCTVLALVCNSTRLTRALPVRSHVTLITQA